jgi:tRNA(Ile)-lysidine synthase
LIADGDSILVGVSGGADSVALLHLLAAAGFRRLVVCHLDHCLRGRAAAADARFVERLAGRLGFSCELGRTDVRALMEESRQSLETAARSARHAFFARCATKHRCRGILLAHHADDQAETVLWNLLRGSHGLKGMRQEQEIAVGRIRLHVIRPLLGVRHAELVGWLSAQGYRWREDASNHEPVCVRNRLRNEVFPLLREVSGRDPVPMLARAAADGSARDELEDALMERMRLRDPQGRLHLPAMRAMPPAVQRAALRKFLMDHEVPQVGSSLIGRALGLLDTANPAAINLPGGRRLRRSAGRIWIGT